MNIFASHPNPETAALWLDDKRANQMIRESGQLLSTAIREKTSWPPDALYKSFNPNHPAAVWCRSSPARFVWTATHMRVLLRRAGKDKHERAREVHAAVIEWYSKNSHRFPKQGLQPFANCTRREIKREGKKDLVIDYTYLTDAHQAYRSYLNARWQFDAVAPTWKTGRCPDWYHNRRKQ